MQQLQSQATTIQNNGAYIQQQIHCYSHNISVINGQCYYVQQQNAEIAAKQEEISGLQGQVGDIEQENFEWTEREVNLSENGYNSQIIYVAFVNTTFDGYILYLDSVQTRIEDPVGNIELQSISVKMYPNPTNDFCIIDCEKPIKSIKISDFNGRLISTLEEQTIDLRNFKSGIYFISLNIENQIIKLSIVNKLTVKFI
jgi:hypothetical protein